MFLHKVAIFVDMILKNYNQLRWIFNLDFQRLLLQDVNFMCDIKIKF